MQFFSTVFFLRMSSLGLLTGAALATSGSASMTPSQGASAPTFRTRLNAHNPDIEDYFGSGPAISGDTIAVGAPWEDSNDKGINGWSGNAGRNWDSGAAYVFVRTGECWIQQAYIKASNADRGDLFGRAVALDGNTLVVGAPSENSAATGVNGDQNSNAAQLSGAVYVFVRNGSTWTQEAYLKASNAESGDYFGASVVLVGDTQVVGAPYEDGGSTGLNGNQLDNSLYRSGAVYVFARRGGTWIQEDYVKASSPVANRGFGQSISAIQSHFVVSEFKSGFPSVHVFTRAYSDWREEAVLNVGELNRRFGTSTAITEDTLLVGAPASGAEGHAYIYQLQGGTWVPGPVLTDNRPGQNEVFGGGVLLSGDTAWVTSSSSTGVHMYSRALGWAPVGTVKTPTPHPHSGGLAVDSGVFLIGAPRAGMAGKYDAGAAFVFDLDDSRLLAREAVRLGSPPNPQALMPGLTSRPVLGATWDPIIDHTLFAPSSILDSLVVSFGGPANLPGPQGTILIASPYVLPFFSTTPGTPFSIPVSGRCGFLGLNLSVQGLSVLPGGGGHALTNALDVVIGTH